MFRIHKRPVFGKISGHKNAPAKLNQALNKGISERPLAFNDHPETRSGDNLHVVGQVKYHKNVGKSRLKCRKRSIKVKSSLYSESDPSTWFLL